MVLFVGMFADSMILLKTYIVVQKIFSSARTASFISDFDFETKILDAKTKT
jgi:hypothetical protein